MLAEHLHCLLPIQSLANHSHIALHVEYGAQPHTRDQMVLSDQNPDLRRHGTGTVTSTWVPLPGWLSSFNSPPNPSARSRIPINPKFPLEDVNTSSGSNPQPESATVRCSCFGSMF